MCAGVVYKVECSPTDPTLIATGSEDRSACLWRINEGRFCHSFLGQPTGVSSLAFSKDGSLLAHSGFDGCVFCWDSTTCELKGKSQLIGGDIEWLSWHPTSHVILGGSGDCWAYAWDSTGEVLNMFAGHSGRVTCGDFTPDGNTICTGSDDASLSIWDFGSQEQRKVIRGSGYHGAGLTCLTISSDSALALTGSKDGSVYVTRLADGEVACGLLPHRDSIKCVAFSPGNNRAAVGSLDHNLFISDVGHLRGYSCEHGCGVTCLAWIGKSGQILVTGSKDGKVQLWDLRSQSATVLGAFSCAVSDLSVSCDENFLVCGSIDGTARVFEIANKLH